MSPISPMVCKRPA
ncbi:hypothetical protein CGLO_13089 [Colletotrichum gloeosporioides Cg-14]|uniref:Uncharacterized protein n=1 Tax=Colletotrichum gloeosporioides (strain Cg-14) TaxID=1237896 RepID=T0L7Y5_COLGC|nr:hypothetical protein CGLO_13089 [Colletotrichum gloeosporioides Cg-14]